MHDNTFPRSGTDIRSRDGRVSRPSGSAPAATPSDHVEAGELERLQAELKDLRMLEQVRQSAAADASAEREQLRAEIARLGHELAALRASPVGRGAGAWNALAFLRPWLARQLMRSAQIAWWTLTLQVHRRFPQMLRERRAAMAAAAAHAPLPLPAPLPRAATPLVTEVLRQRFISLQPFPVYRVQGLAPRLTLVTDSINSGSLFGGVATAIILAVLLAKALQRKLRVLTRTERPHQENFHHVLQNAGIDYAESVEFVCSSVGARREVDVGDDEFFITTSWWTTYACRKCVKPERIIYLLQEDERQFYPAGDDQLRCSETLSDPATHVIVNTKLLADYLVSEGFENIRKTGLWFEPAFPSATHFPEPSRPSRRNFFFYARPTNFRNLFYRGIEAIDEAVQRGVLDPQVWDIHFVGKDLDPSLADLPFRPKLIENLPWSDYTALIRKMDLGLSLMFTPHPSYPPLDLAASGAVVVTNRYRPKQDLDHYSKNVICADDDVDSLVEAIGRGVELALDKERRLKNYQNSHFNRDWAATFDTTVQTLSKRLCS